MDPDEAYEKAQASRQALLQAVDRLSEQEMNIPGVEGEWTVKDLVWHITSWEDVCLPPLKNMVNGQGFAAEVIQDHDAWNKGQSDLRRGLSMADTLKTLVRVRLELFGLFDQLSEQDWDQEVTMPWGQVGTPAQLLAGLAWHEMEHVKSIQKWLDNQKPADSQVSH